MNIGLNGCLLIAAGIVIAFLAWSLESEKAQNHVLRQENILLDQILKDEQTKAQKAISEANDRIQQYELNKTKYEAKINSKVEVIENETKAEEVRIVTELQKDDSSENQLKLVEGILHEFSSKR